MERPIDALENLADHGIFLAKLGSKCEPSLIAVAERNIPDQPDSEDPIIPAHKTYVIGPGSNGFLRYRIEMRTRTSAIVETTQPGVLDVRLPDGTRYDLVQTKEELDRLVRNIPNELEFQNVRMTQYTDFVRVLI